MFQESVPGIGGDIFKRLVKGPSREKYGEDIRRFALTLSFYSTKAYNYVRETFNKSLPHVSTISKWYQSIDGSPGFTQEAFNALKAKVTEEKTKGQSVICNLVIDEMSIMQRVEWTGRKYAGFVDLGTGVESEAVPEAKEVLVFLLVALNGRWKIPVGYVLIDGLNGPEKANLMNKLLEQLHETGVVISSLTFDGASSNLKMASELGADFTKPSDLKTYFHHPITKEKIFIFLDPCHMLKLIRNCLASQKALTDGEGKSILWSYFEALSELQYSEGLKAGTKLSKRHIQWFREKMKVKLAAQTLSNSVADAFIYLSKDLLISQFKDVEATSNFTRIVNNLFDIFNTQSRFSNYPFRKALSMQTADDIFSYLNFCKNYINQLSLRDELVVNSRRKTGFIGFLICIESLHGLFKQYIVETPLLKYLVTYKLSQDHLEIFFSVVRSKGGFNNNPTAWQFESIYKRLLIHSELRGSVYANVTAMDKTSILYCSSRITRNNMGEDLLESEEYKKICRDIDDLDFLQSSAWHLTSYCSDVVAYIAGFVVKSLKKCLTCETCLNVLETEESFSMLQTRKCYGGLINASALVVETCRAAEKIFRLFLLKGYFGNIAEHKSGLKWTGTPQFVNISNLLIHQVLRNLPPTIFQHFGDHIFDLDEDNYHPLEVIKLILKKYVNIRIHHETKKFQDLKQTRVRSVLTKTILFKHQ